MFPILFRRTDRNSVRSRPARPRRARLEPLEDRLLLTYADFELSGLLPVNGGNGSAGSVISGVVGGGRLGFPLFGSKPVGDVNQDGFDDILLAAPGSGSQVGQAYLIFGRPGGFPAELHLGGLDGSSGYRINGFQPGDFNGPFGGGAGDVNGDDIPDLVLSGNGKTASSDNLIGDRSFVLYGGPSHLIGLDLGDGSLDGQIYLATLDGSHGFTINGVAAAGSTSQRPADRVNAAGDLNADGVDDLVIGAPYNEAGVAGPGRVFVVFGRGPSSTAGASFPAQFELASLDGSNGFVIPAPAIGGALGTAVGGAGDFNGDGTSDLVLGAMFADTAGRVDAGQAFVIFGRPSFPASLDLATLNGTNGFVVNGGAAGDFLGSYAVGSAGDVNGDGLDDVLISASGVDASGAANVGGAYVILGKSTAIAGGFPAALEVSSLNGINGFVLHGVTAGDFVNNAYAAGDLNGDGFGDILVGAASADPNGVNNAGQTYVVYGRQNFGSSLALGVLLAANGGDGSRGYAINGFLADSAPTGTIAAIGDVNGDGFDDLRIGTYSADPGGLTDAGQVYIVYGKASPTVPTTKFYVVNDAGSDRTFEYGAAGATVEDYALVSGNTAPRGAASTAAGDRVWVVDANKKVYVYNNAGSLLGSWSAGNLASNATVQGIATDGNDIWIVDAQQDKVFRYTGAASRTSGSQNAVSSFALNSSNTGPKDLVTDGASVWVVNDATTDKVFKYSLTGTLQGSWSITGAGASPTGITLDPSGGGTLWIVDNGTDRVYQFDNTRGLTSGSLSPSTSFALAAGNTNPQGIADPPVVQASTIREIPTAPAPRPARVAVVDRFELAAVPVATLDQALAAVSTGDAPVRKRRTR